MTSPPAGDRAISGLAMALPANGRPKAAQRSGTGTLVCVVDDDESVRDSLHTLLDSLGFAVTTYASGREMLADERRHQASCLIVDQHMPGMDGLATLGALRGEGSNVPMILITGRLDTKIAARAKALDVGAVLEKPFAVARLLELIRGPGEPTR